LHELFPQTQAEHRGRKGTARKLSHGSGATQVPCMIITVSFAGYSMCPQVINSVDTMKSWLPLPQPEVNCVDRLSFNNDATPDDPRGASTNILRSRGKTRSNLFRAYVSFRWPRT
jgi:hypothetical protein